MTWIDRPSYSSGREQAKPANHACASAKAPLIWVRSIDTEKKPTIVDAPIFDPPQSEKVYAPGPKGYQNGSHQGVPAKFAERPV